MQARNRIEFGNPALCGWVKAFRFPSHFKEHFLFLQLPGKLFFQCLKKEQTKKLLCTGIILYRIYSAATIKLLAHKLSLYTI
jgi:hypothetical protein